MASDGKSRLEALTGARFIAALSVVLLHYGDRLMYPKWLKHPALHGQAGVGFFFVLSGFVLVYNYGDRLGAGLSWQACKAFYRARFARIYPLHLLVLLAITPLVLLQAARAPETLFDPWDGEGWFSLASWLAQALLLQAWVPFPALQATWPGSKRQAAGSRMKASPPAQALSAPACRIASCGGPR